MKKSGISWKRIFTRPGSPFKNEPFLWGEGFADNKIHLQGNNLIHSQESQDTWYIDKDEWELFYKEIEKRSSSLNYLAKTARKTRNICEEIIGYSSRIKGEASARKSNKELNKDLERVFQLFLGLNFDLWAFWVMESCLDKKLEGLLINLLGKGKERNKLLKYKTVLTTKTGLIDAEREELHLLEIKTHFQKEGLSKKVDEMLRLHVQEFGWIPVYDFATKPWNKKHFLNVLKELPEDPQEEIKKRLNRLEKNKRLIESILSRFNNNELNKLVEILQEFLILKTYRTDTLRKAFYNLLGFVDVLSKRLKLSHQNLIFLSISEVRSSLKNGKRPPLVELKRRRKSHVILKIGKNLKVYSKKNEIDSLLNTEVPTASEEESGIGGTPASLGKAVGVVKIINKANDVKKMEKGNILISRMTFPDLIVAMRKAAAIVTDEGGITCHAAIVSREFGIPCVIGTKNATRIFSDGDKVEVDATKGTVRKIT